MSVMVWIADHTVTLISSSSDAALQLHSKLCDLPNTFPIDSFYFLKLAQLLYEVKNSDKSNKFKTSLNAIARKTTTLQSWGVPHPLPGPEIKHPQTIFLSFPQA